MTPLPSSKALDTYFLEARSKLLDVAGILDRIGRGGDVSGMSNDPRLERIRDALAVLQDESGGRAERIQKIFSLDYDSSWERPKPGVRNQESGIRSQESGVTSRVTPDS